MEGTSFVWESNAEHAKRVGDRLVIHVGVMSPIQNTHLIQSLKPGPFIVLKVCTRKFLSTKNMW